MGGVSDSGFTELSVIPQADVQKTVRKYACRNGGISASRFTDYQLTCQHIWRRQSRNLLPEMVGWIFLPADLLTVS